MPRPTTWCRKPLPALVKWGRISRLDEPYAYVRTVAGRPARYYERTEQDGGSVLLVVIGSCGIQIDVQDRTKIPRRPGGHVHRRPFDKCDSTRTWTRPLN